MEKLRNICLFMLPIAILFVNIGTLVRYNKNKKNDELLIILFALTSLVCCISLIQVVTHLV